jgi:6-phosphofructokinase 2
MACSAASVQPTHKIRTFDERLDAGGGGINVARVIHALGGDALALIMTGDVTGRLVEELLSDANVPWRAIPIRGRTRISVNVHDQRSGLEYRFVPMGPHVEPNEMDAALDALRTIEADWIVASGSLPRGVRSDFYAEVAAIARRRDQKFALDTSGAALSAAVGRGLELLKLSQSELEFMIGRKAPDAATQEQEVAALTRAGAARRIAVSLGREGAILGSSNGVLRLPAPPVEARSSVGAGDAFLAGLVLGLARRLTDRDALALGVAAGSAAVVTCGTAQVQKANVDVLYRELCGISDNIRPDIAAVASNLH